MEPDVERLTTSEGGPMPRKKSTPDAAGVTLKEVVMRYVRMSDAEVDAELARYGINPQPTVDAVTALVKARLAERDRRSLHQEALLMLLLFPIAAMQLQQTWRGAHA